MRSALLMSLPISLPVLALAGCGSLEGLGGPTPPLVTFTVQVDGDLASVRAPGDTSVPTLNVALVWGDQWLTEPFCILPPESPEAAAVIAAGCRDPFGFVALRVAGNTPVTLGVPASISLYELPSADVMVGDVTARVAYGSFVVYDDRSTNGTLDLAGPHRTASGGDERRGGDDSPDSTDVVYGASFATMTAPDQRVAFREGGFNALAAFYPRSGCAPPPPSKFSILSAGGFSAAAGLASAVTGTLPPEDPATCAEAAPEAAVLHIGLQAPADVREVSCIERSSDSSSRYREPPAAMPDLTGRLTACAHLPSFDAGNQSSLMQFVVSGRPGDRCKGLTHYTLRGCRENVACPLPDWDYKAADRPWWPCH